MKRTILAILCTIICVLGLGMTTASAESYYGNFEYTISNGEVTITLYDNSETEVIIPHEIEGHPVTSIGEYAFLNCYSPETIIIPDSVTTIEESAFTHCYRLTSIVIPDSVTIIGDFAFVSCRSLTSVVIPDSVKTIGEYAFSHCNNLTSVTIPKNVEYIGASVFYNCRSLTEIIVDENNISYCSENGILFSKDKTVLKAYPAGKSEETYIIQDGVTSIEVGAFGGCDNLKSITIPDGVTTIGDCAFALGTSLTAINVAVNNADYCSENGILFTKDKTVLIAYPPAKSQETYIIPNTVKTIGKGSFDNCGNLTSITIPDGASAIGDSAFSDCSSLTNVTIPNSVTTIEVRAFGECTNLTDVYYNGTKSDWDCIKIFYSGNECLEKATIHYSDGTTSKDASTSTTIEGNTYIVTPNNVDSGYVIIFACYKGKSLVYKDIYTYENENEIIFTPNGEHDKVKIMVWESVTNLKPVCEAEEILLTT